MKSTIKIDELVAEVNRLNRESICEPAVREGWNSLVTHFLMRTDRYHGFAYLLAKDVPAGQEPGIVWNEKKPSFPDETRVSFGIRPMKQRAAR